MWPLRVEPSIWVGEVSSGSVADAAWCKCWCCTLPLQPNPTHMLAFARSGHKYVIKQSRVSYWEFFRDKNNIPKLYMYTMYTYLDISWVTDDIQINQSYHNVDLIHHLNHDLLKDVRWPGGNQLDMKSSSSMEVWTIYWWGETFVIVIIRKTALIYKKTKKLWCLS